MGISHGWQADSLDAALLLALDEQPRATVLALSEALAVSRNTVQARLTRLQKSGALKPYGRCVEPASIGYPLEAFVAVEVVQRLLDQVNAQLAAIPEVLEVLGLSGTYDLLVRVVARHADDLYRVAGRILSTEGVVRTETSLVMRRLTEHRLRPLLQQRRDEGALTVRGRRDDTE